MLRPNLKIVCAATLALVLAGCDVNIEPTDLSAVAIENDRTAIEKTLGKPDKVVDARGFTLASYPYDKGYHASAEAPTGIPRPASTAGGGLAGLGWLVITAVAAPIDHAARTSKARPGQIGKLAAVYDIDQKLVFAGLLDDPDSKIQTLEELVATFIASQSDDADALLYLSYIALVPDQKSDFFEKAVKFGSAEAAFELGETYARGIGTEKNEVKAVEWWLKAGRQDYAPAFAKLGKAYQTGSGIERDLEQALSWTAKAARSGDEEAQKMEADLARVVPFLQGNIPETPTAKYELALAYERVITKTPNGSETMRLLRQSAEQGYSPAQSELSKRYLNGEFNEENREQAKIWLANAAETGNANAMNTLKKLSLEEGRIAKWRDAALMGGPVSQRNLGNAYRFGEGVGSDINQALAWYETAASNGDLDSMFILGTLHELGDEIRRDRVAAYKWYSIAEPDYAIAKLRKRYLEEEMTSPQIDEAEQFAREWREAHP
jgi:TPR repeat protein